ncbi:hypothetical protein Rsub_02017 [Raphidocelis subcapitata]|uniref:Uncharacterized protein n=1 Tax=Raphidocelis subcapitata TaxID=307507 RepID=A0A2V0NX97_9CHLO|nr:hypothetical protein Rsub_02017 [Raphidocelis subcapitata]|eukprot:GBF89445.1 hypothetical protein Rsub_02017 [Raphidocelis subcapitata]
MVTSATSARAADACTARQQPLQLQALKQQPASSAPGASPCDALQQTLRVARAPLKRRSTGLASAGRGLSKHYVGKSQSFSCLEELRNPFGCNTALLLAKRPRAPPLDVPGAAAARSPFAANGSHLLSWSIGEEDECLIGGTACSAPLTASAPSSRSSSGLLALGDCPSLAGSSCGELHESRWAAFAARRSWDSIETEDDDAHMSAFTVDGELSAALRGARLGAPLPAGCGGMWRVGSC